MLQLYVRKAEGTLTTASILQSPDFGKTFVVTTDASDRALGAILSQGPIGEDLPICYASRTLNKAQQNYSTADKELLAIVWGISQFRPYVYGSKFTVVTDHKPLTWLFSIKDPGSRLMRWKIKLSEHEFDIVYKAGKRNMNANALSRICAVTRAQARHEASERDVGDNNASAIMPSGESEAIATGERDSGVDSDKARVSEAAGVSSRRSGIAIR